jgi:hypothetical protein
LFPELYLEGYRADERFSLIAETIPGPATERLTAVTRKHGLYIIMGMARIEEPYLYLVYNSLCFVSPDELVGEGYYDKIHSASSIVMFVMLLAGRKTYRSSAAANSPRPSVRWPPKGRSKKRTSSMAISMSNKASSSADNGCSSGNTDLTCTVS